VRQAAGSKKVYLATANIPTWKVYVSRFGLEQKLTKGSLVIAFGNEVLAKLERAVKHVDVSEVERAK
jgi:hypothetical protein